MMERYDEGRDVLERAIQIATSRDSATLTPDEHEAFQSLYRYLVNNRKYAKDRAGARRWALEGLRHFPDDVSCKKYLRDDDTKKQE